MKEPLLILTRYYFKPWTWIKRVIEFLVAGGFLYWISKADTSGEYGWIKYVIFTILFVYIFTRPVDELAVSKNTLFYIRKSAIKYFTRVEEFDLSQIKSIGWGGLYDADTEFFGKARPRSNRLEIVYNDNTSQALDIKIYKRELKWIVKSILKIINDRKA